jgi:hypothetical protein
LQAAGPLVCINSFAGGDAMCSCGGHSCRCGCAPIGGDS